jgi:hypothetical protein
VNNLTLKISGLPHQLELYKSNIPGSITALIGGLGSGKTTALVTKAILLSILYPGYGGMLVEPTYRLATDTLVPTFHEVIQRDFPFLRYQHKVADSVIVIPDLDTRILLRSGDRPEKLRGPNLAWVGIDEPGQMSKEVFTDAAGRARVSNCRQVFLTGTPEGINWFSELFDVPQEPYRTIRAQHRHPSIAKPYEDHLRVLYRGQESLLNAYLEGRFVPLYEGRCYPTYDARKHVTEESEFSQDSTLILACDFNVDPLCWLVIQESGHLINVIDEIIVTGTTQDACNEFLSRYPRPRVRNNLLEIFGDRSGKSNSTRSNDTDYQIMRVMLKDGDYSPVVLVPDANPAVINRVNSVNKILTDKRIRINPRCKALVESLNRTTWKPGTRNIDKPTGETWTHPTDALGYYITKRYPITGTARFQTNQTGLTRIQGPTSLLNTQIW